MGSMSETAAALAGPLGRRLLARRADVIEALDRLGATNPRVFGSVARGEEQNTSDLDLLVDLAAGTSLFEIFRAQDELHDILDVEVDVVAAASLKTAARARIESDAVPL
jgi:uncharacterized protein